MVGSDGFIAQKVFGKTLEESLVWNHRKWDIPPLMEKCVIVLEKIGTHPRHTHTHSITDSLIHSHPLHFTPLHFTPLHSTPHHTTIPPYHPHTHTHIHNLTHLLTHPLTLTYRHILCAENALVQVLIVKGCTVCQAPFLVYNFSKPP